MERVREQLSLGRTLNELCLSSCTAQAFMAGNKHSGYGGWTGWRAGDQAIFELGPSTLTMHHIRLQKSFTLTLREKYNPTYRLHLNMHAAHDKVTVLSMGN